MRSKPALRPQAHTSMPSPNEHRVQRWHTNRIARCIQEAFDRYPGSISELAKLSGLSRKAIYDILVHATYPDPSSGSLDSLAKVFKLKVLRLVSAEEHEQPPVSRAD